MRTLQGPNGAPGASSSGFGNLSIAGGALALQAGMAIQANDLLTIDEDGLAYPVTDAACVVNPNKDQSIIATTTPVASGSAASTTNRPILFADGTYMVLTEDTSNSRIYFSLYARGGTLLKQAFAAASSNNPVRWGRLSNGNIAIFAVTTSVARAMVIAPDTSTVVAWTTLESAVSLNSMPDLLCLSGGGFAVTWSIGSPAQIRFAIYSNTITTVLAPTTLSTAPSAATANSAILRQFANGNIALFTRQATAGRELMLGIYTAAGVTVLALANWAPAAGAEQVPAQVAVLGNFMCAVWMPSGNVLTAAVINSSGVQQGTTYTLAAMVGTFGAATDGTDFLILASSVTGNYANCIRLPTTGGANAVNKTLNSTLHSLSSGAGFLFVDNEWLVSYNVPSTSVTFVRVTLEGLVVAGGSISVSLSQYYHADPVQYAPGVAIFTHCNASSHNAFTVKRYRSAAIQGVAAAAAARFATVQAVAANGTYQCNPIVCTTPTNFNHNATSVIGQRGTLYPRGVAFRGLV